MVALEVAIALSSLSTPLIVHCTPIILPAGTLVVASSLVRVHCPKSSLVTPANSLAPTASVAISLEPTALAAISAAFTSPSLIFAAVTALPARSDVPTQPLQITSLAIVLAMASGSGEAKMNQPRKPRQS